MNTLIAFGQTVHYNGAMVIRERYLAPIREFYETDLVKVIIGVRRSGKSIILEQIRDEIALKNDNIIYLNFEKESDLMKASTHQELLSYVERNRKDGKCYLFLDEIQEVEDWQIAVKDLRLGNNSVFITGSNSKLLSREILSLLSGRFVSFRVRPFVYKEIVELSRQAGFDPSLTDYLVWGGFPGRFGVKSVEATKAFLFDLEATIVYNDLIKRFGIRKVTAFKKIVNFVIKSQARILSSRSIYRYLKGEGINISLNTVIEYLDHLKDAYLIDEIPQYSSKAKSELSYYGKVYLADVSFNSLHVEDGRFDLDHNLENIVYSELLYRGYSLKVYKNGSKEVDFLAQKEGRSYFVQVCYSLLDQKAYEREFSAFSNLDPNVQRIIISNDDLDYSTSLVRHIKFKDFLLFDDL